MAEGRSCLVPNQTNSVTFFQRPRLIHNFGFILAKPGFYRIDHHTVNLAREDHALMTPIHFPLRSMSLFQMPDLAQKPPAYNSILDDAPAPLQSVALSDGEPCAARIQCVASRWSGIHWYRELPDWQPAEVY